MTIFQVIGDFIHLTSIFILLSQIDVTKSCAGISFKTQVLYFLVFVTRYASLFVSWISFYTFIMKLFFLGYSSYIIYQMWFIYKDTYDHTHDSFKAEFLLLGSALFSIVAYFEIDFYENLRVFSLFLESVAILPQFLLLIRKGEAEAKIIQYIALLGSYRVFYIVNWMVKYSYQGIYFHWFIWFTGVLQTIFYLAFSIFYIIKFLL